ncbi:hypothetical protein BDZ89DRAFT_1088082 [Hymenopellis radicata]|nr:hypothetical protein BDZ89DRAFT_1088082 [Hymenopellis radicata]
MAASTPQPPAPLPASQFSQDEEDAIIHTRIYNDDRPLRRVVKKFHTYVASKQASDGKITTEDARESFLVELEAFRLALSKSAMICDAEARQVEEYQKERQRIEDDHSRLIGQIEQLKGSLEHAQIIRRRKMEYDLVAEKINTLPSRDELDKIIESLENDIVTIRAEHETLNHTIHAQKLSFDSIVSNLGVLRLSGNPIETTATTPRLTPAPDGSSGRAQRRNGSDDIEMGEVEEDPKGKKKAREDMEEGEATDASSELSEPPDDDDEET